MATAVATQNIGKVVQVIGPVLDVEFEAEHLPAIYNALRIDAVAPDGSRIDVTAEVQQHIGRNAVRAVAMSSTDAVVRGMETLSSAPVWASDIRAGVGLVLAGLCADGVTEVWDVFHIDRGYPNFVQNLRDLGANIERANS